MVKLRKEKRINHNPLPPPLNVVFAFVTGFVKIGLNMASKVFYFFPYQSFGCRLPNLEAAAQAIFALQHFSIIVEFVIADSKKKHHVRPGGVSCISYTTTACLRDTILTKPVGGLKDVKKT